MKVEFIKDHLLTNKGEILELENDFATYLIRCNVAIATEKEAKPKKVTKPKK